MSGWREKVEVGGCGELWVLKLRQRGDERAIQVQQGGRGRASRRQQATAGWSVGASGLSVGWQWMRPANQRITGVGERCTVH